MELNPQDYSFLSDYQIRAESIADDQIEISGTPNIHDRSPDPVKTSIN